MKMKAVAGIGIGILVLLVGGTMWSQRLQESDPSVITRNGLHWHPTVEIFIGTEKVNIPQGIGLIGTHNPVHTHEDLPVIHLEFSGTVREKDVMLGEFFQAWGKDMLSFGENMRMTVNGIDNKDFGNYIMRDKDVIELHYDLIHEYLQSDYWCLS